MFSSPSKALARVAANGAVIVDPTLTTLTGVDRIVALGSNTIASASRQWIFIAATGSSYKFVRHDGVKQQDIPFDADIDISSFNVSPDGAIEFLGTRTSTQEKIHGSVAAGATDVVITSAGVLDPAQVITFTRVN